VYTGRAYTRYKMFSTDKEWLPDSIFNVSLDDRCILSGGVEAVKQYITGEIKHLTFIACLMF
jgi:hypothetical protein